MSLLAQLLADGNPDPRGPRRRDEAAVAIAMIAIGLALALAAVVSL